MRIARFRFPEKVNTSGVYAIGDRTGRIFLVGRSLDRASLVVYDNATRQLLMNPAEAYGTPALILGPNGDALIYAVERDQEHVGVYTIPGFVPHTFRSS